ncbi:MAG TPA: hypothetical protein VKA84_08550 [Gemmatimonadaceae bacterium]|nr:hypothetical protein [Gemmatimonadaceae bacterium]
MRTRLLRRAAALGALGLTGIAVGACQDLTVPNQNNPDRDKALQNPGDVEALIGGSWRVMWSRQQSGTSVVYTLPLVADEMSATYANEGALELASEPRAPYNNSTIADAGGLARFPWYDFHSILSSANETLMSIDSGLVILTTDSGSTERDNTQRARAFAKLMQGVSLGYLGMLYDQAWAVREHTDTSLILGLPFSPYREVMDSALLSLDEAVAIARANSFITPRSWVVGVPLPNEELARVASSYAARILVYGARTPEERAAVDWQRVLDYANAGIRQDLSPEMSSNTITSTYLSISQRNTLGTVAARADYRLVGPADTSGEYQKWMAKPLSDRVRFNIATADRRVTGAGGPTTSGTYFRYLADNNNLRPERGVYHFSGYQWFRNNGTSSSGLKAIMTVDEMRLIKAEALARLGRFQEAADSANVTRIANGKLDSVTASGGRASTTPPPAPPAQPVLQPCVPRTDSGACGDLLYSIMYERMIEAAGLDAMRAYLDRRGWGTLAPGTFIQLPVPARELQTLRMAVYTFGGGGPGSAK